MRTLFKLALVLVVVTGCQTNPYTGRSQLIMIDRDTEIRMGVQAYQEMLGSENVTYDPTYLEPVQRAAMRMAAIIEQGWDQIPPPRYDWEVKVVDDPKTLNAWCLPGGKICVYTGIFPVMHDEAGLAVVMGHEMMHAILRHGVERVSQGMLAEIGVTVLTEVLGGDDPAKKQQMYALLGLGAALGILLPYSRTGETEADEWGLYLAAKAGYDPRAGIEVWQRMEQLSGSGGPEFLSTHPSHGTRIENMKRWLPKAMEYYEQSQKVEIAALPGASGARTVRPSTGLATAGIRTGRAQHATINGSPGASFEFEFARDSYIRDIVVQGPGGLSTTIDAKTPLERKAVRAVNLWRQDPNADPLPRGTYRMTFRGKTAGDDFEETVAWELD